jgi:hypothetical protein
VFFEGFFNLVLLKLNITAIPFKKPTKNSPSSDLAESLKVGGLQGTGLRFCYWFTMYT